MIFAEVILPISLPGTFTYFVPEELVGDMKNGIRVEVSFGRRKNYSGIVHHTHSEKPAIRNIKPITGIIDEEPIVHQDTLDLWEWIADYYLCSLGEVMDAALPAYLKLSSETIFYVNPTEEFLPDQFTDSAYVVYEALQLQDHLMRKDIEDILEGKNVYKTIKELIGLRAIYTTESIKDKVKPKSQKLVSLSPAYDDPQKLQTAFEKVKNAPQQESLLMHFLQMHQNTKNDIPKKTLLENTEYSPAVYKALIDKNILIQKEQDIDRVHFEPKEILPIILNPEQQKVYDAIQNSPHTQHLIHGVTGSGKTFIYLKLIRDVVSKGKQALFLVPEIALTTQLIELLLSYLGNDLVVYHSKYNAQERVEVYNKVRESSAKVVLGVRSAVMLPFQNLGVVIIDEEHENTYKQHNPAPRYHARDVARHITQIHEVPCIMGSATPSLDMLFLAQNDKIGYHLIQSRYQDARLPSIEIVDVKKEHQEYKNKTIFSQKLLDEIQESLNRSKQVILFQNRRGYNPFVICYSCGQVPSCEQCDVSLTYHKHRDLMVCHYCSRSYTPYQTCPSCGQQTMTAFSFGTEKVEEELQSKFPYAHIERMDYDTTRNKNAHTQIIQKFESGKIDVLIGTQMVTKGLHFENVDLVGILAADGMVSFPDYRAHENAIQTWIQVAGRAGRNQEDSKVLIQTLKPENNIIQFFAQNDYMAFVEQELQQRQDMVYPPYCKLIKVIFRHRDKSLLDRAALFFYEKCDTQGLFSIKKPYDASISKIKSFYIVETYVKIPLRKSSLDYTKSMLKKADRLMHEHLDFRYVYSSFVVDPI